MSRIGFLNATQLLLGGLLLFTLAPRAEAGDPVFIWPGSGVCAGTLQACIDSASAGAIVEVNSDAVIDENLVLPNSRTLRATEGRRPRLAAGRGITGSFSGVSAVTVVVKGMSLSDARVQLSHSGTGTASFEVSDSYFSSSSGQVGAGIDIDFSQAGSASRGALIARNQMQVGAPGLFDAGIGVQVSGGSATLDIRHNRIRAKGDTAGDGLSVEASGGAVVSADIFANEISGAFSSAMRVAEGRFSTTGATLTARIVSNSLVGGGNQRGGGLSLVVGDGEIAGTVLNNTVVFGRGIVINRWGGIGPRTGVVSGQIQNNLIAYTQFGLQNSPTVGGTASNDYNLKFANNPSGLHTAGANDLSVNPQLRSLLAPRLTAGSPAIDAGNSFALSLALQLADTDGDGLRRIIGTVDIGAYEFGHRALLARKTANSAAPEAPVIDIDVSFDSGRRLFATRNFELSGLINPHPVGVSFFDQWFVVNSNNATMPQNSATNVFAPLGSANTGVFQHLANGSNTLDNGTLVDWSRINGDPSWIILLTQATPFGAPFNTSPTVLDYAGTRWNIVTANGSNLTINTRWNLYSQRSSPQAFVHTVTSRNQPGSPSITELDHPLLNSAACAQFQVTALARDGVGGSLVDTEYVQARGRHRLFSNNGSIPLGARYNVLVLPAQIDECTGGPLFLDGFEGFPY